MIDPTQTSDEMIDIQLEESLQKESLMLIDSANPREQMTTVIGYLSLVLLMTFIGIFGPSQVVMDIQKIELVPEDTTKYQIFVPNIQLFSKFISFELFFNRKSSLETKYAENKTISAAFDIDGQDPNIVEEITNTSVITYENMENSSAIELKRYSQINFPNLQIQLVISKSQYNCAYLKIQLQNSNFGFYEIIIRVIFFLTLSIFFSVFYIRLKDNFRYSHLEQKLSIGLVFLGILACNPFIYIEYTYPSKVLSTINMVASSLFTSAFHVYFLTLFDLLCMNHKRFNDTFFISRGLFWIVLFIQTLFRNFYYMNHTPTQNPTINILDAIIAILYVIWACYSIFSANSSTDITERYKFNTYSLTFVCYILVTFIVDTTFGNIYKNSVKFIVSFSLKNLFVLFMAYMHWPYEVNTDHVYEETDGDGMPDHKFVNSDADVMLDIDEQALQK